ncbi:MAG: hypothetical protein ACYTEV_06955 [Planctomycetota bacterium]
MPCAVPPGTSRPLTVRFATARLVAEAVDPDRLRAMSRVLADAIVHRFLESERRCRVQRHHRRVGAQHSRQPASGSWLLRLRHAAVIEPVGSVEVWLEPDEPARVVCLVHPSHHESGYEHEVIEGLMAHLDSCRPVREAMIHVNRRRGLREEFQRWMADLVSIDDRGGHAARSFRPPRSTSSSRSAGDPPA